jgi:acetoin utilization deacetylase AcuC-like enzyme
MRVVFSPSYHIDIGAHVFPTRKYQLLYDRIRASFPDATFVEPQPASWDDLALVHTREYLQKTRTGDFSVAELAQLELPWSPGVAEGFRLMTGGTIEAARQVMTGRTKSISQPLAFHIGGGFHHAFANHGEGFCLFNDVAVSIRLLRHNGSIQRAAVIDLDVHHGNGTAFIFANERDVFTFSMHHQNNYPADKPKGSLDIGLPDGTGDEAYLSQLSPALERVVAHRPEIVFYLAGADPYEDDQLGGLSLSKAGLRERDRLVLRAFASSAAPIVGLLAGGYARRIEDTVDIHFATFDEARKFTAASPGIAP